MSFKLKRKIDSLAKRRYGDTPGARDHVVADALWWRMKQWDKEGIGLWDLFWIKLAYSRIPFLNSLAMGKLIAPYFETEEGK